MGGKGDRCVRLTTYHHPVPLSRNLGTLTFWNPLGLFRPVMGLLYLYLFLLYSVTGCVALGHGATLMEARKRKFYYINITR